MLSIREAGIDQIPVIAALARETWPEAYKDILSAAQLEYMLALFYSAGSLAEQIEEKGHHFILVYEQETPVGFASFSPRSDDEPHIYRLHKIYVLPGQQGRGTGMQLLNAVISRAAEAGATGLELNVNRHNKARFFYEKNGFTIIREEDINIGNGYWMNDYVMLKNVQI